jgi:hypothetical protein
MRPLTVAGSSIGRSSWPRIAVCAAAVVVAFAVRADEDSPTRGSPRAGAVEELAPELFYLEDDGGRLVPVPGFRYRDFVDLFRIKEGLAGPMLPPGAVLEDVVIRVDARGVAAPANGRGQVACPVTAEFTIRQVAAGWTPIALELDGLVLSAAPRHEGAGRMIVDAEPGRGGYRAWFEATPDPGGDVRHTVSLEGRLPVETTATQESLAVRLPAAMTSRLDVRSNRPSPAVVVQPDGPQPDVTEEAEGGSTVSIRGVAGDVRLRIGDAEEGRDRRGPAAQAASESTIRVDGRNAVTATTIRLANLSPGARRLSIRLPAQSTVREVRSPAALLARGGTAADPTAEIGIDVDPDGRATVELVCERPIDPSGDAPFEAVGFSVDGIAEWRQWGRVSLVVDGEWLVSWSDVPQLRRVDPPATTREPGFVAAFAYDALPASLPLRVRPRRSRVVIEPEYRYDVGGTRVTLDARLRVAARGAPVGSISVGLDPAWAIDEVGPPGAVDAGGVTSDGGVLVVPFAQPLAGDVVVEVRATLPVGKEATRVAWNLPTPKADVVGPAAVVVASQGDIELLPDNETILGLVRQTAASAAVSDADKTALVYRLDGADGTFAANRRFLPRRVEASIVAQVSVDAAEISVEEVIRLNVLHVALESIEVAVPATVVAAGGITIRCNDVSLDPTEIGPVVDADDGDEPAATRVRAILPEPLLGAGEVTVGFRLPAPAIPPQATLAVDVPHVQPLDTSIGRESVTIVSPEATVVGVRGDAWRRDVAPAATTAQAWTAVKVQRSIPLTLSTRGAEATRSMVVEAAWLQTRLMPGVREEIRRYVVSSARNTIVMTLPDTAPRGAGAETSHEVRLDGDIVPAPPGGGRLVIDLPRADPDRRWRVDVRTTVRRRSGWATLAESLGLPARVVLTPPIFEPPVVEQRFYWTVHLRPDEHLFGLPVGWTSQQRWQRGSFGWEQKPAATPLQIADWMSAAAGRDAGSDPVPRGIQVPPLAERSVVYSGVGSPGDAVLWVAPNWCLVLAASGASLAAALAAIYRSAFRRAGLWIVATAALAVAAAAAPDIAPLVAQAALPGLGLGALAWGLRALTDRRAAAVRVTSPASSASSLTRLTAAPPSLLVASGIDEASTRTQARGS